MPPQTSDQKKKNVGRGKKARNLDGSGPGARAKRFVSRTPRIGPKSAKYGQNWGSTAESGQCLFPAWRMRTSQLDNIQQMAVTAQHILSTAGAVLSKRDSAKLRAAVHANKTSPSVVPSSKHARLAQHWSRPCLGGGKGAQKLASFSDHRPPTSTARTTRRALPSSPEISGKFLRCTICQTIKNQIGPK